MISIHSLMTTLTNEVCGFNDSTTASTLWKRAGMNADRVKWRLWRHEEAMCIIEDLQRQKLA